MKKFMRNLSGVVLIFFVVVLTGCTDVDKSSPKPEARGYIWVATKGDYKVKLVGTMHPAPTTHRLLTDEIQKVLKDTDVLSVEVDITLEESIKKVQDSLYLKNGETIEDYLSDTELKKVQGIVDGNGVQYLNIKNFNAVGLSQFFDQLLIMKTGFIGTTLDSLMINWAKANKVEVNELEGTDFQIDLFNDIYTWDGVKEIINEYSTENIKKLEDNAKQVFEDYLNGDEVNAIKSVDELKKAEPEIYKILAVDRNIGMVNKIEELVKDNRKHTIAVGYRHFIGDDSILNMLEEKGYTITRIN